MAALTGVPTQQLCSGTQILLYVTCNDNKANKGVQNQWVMSQWLHPCFIGCCRVPAPYEGRGEMQEDGLVFTDTAIS